MEAFHCTRKDLRFSEKLEIVSSGEWCKALSAMEALQGKAKVLSSLLLDVEVGSSGHALQNTTSHHFLSGML